MNIPKIALSLVFVATIASLVAIGYDTFGPKYPARIAISKATEQVIKTLRVDPDNLAVAMIGCDIDAHGPVQCLIGGRGKGVITINYLAGDGDGWNRKVFGSRRVWVDEKTNKVTWSKIEF